MGRQKRKLTFIEHLLWVECFLHITILKALVATTKVGIILPETEAWWDEADRPSVPLPENRQLGCPLRFVFSFASWCLAEKPFSVLWAPWNFLHHVSRGERVLQGSSTQSWTQGKLGYRPGEKRWSCPLTGLGGENREALSTSQTTALPRSTWTRSAWNETVFVVKQRHRDWDPRECTLSSFQDLIWFKENRESTWRPEILLASDAKNSTSYHPWELRWAAAPACVNVSSFPPVDLGTKSFTLRVDMRIN